MNTINISLGGLKKKDNSSVNLRENNEKDNNSGYKGCNDNSEEKPSIGISANTDDNMMIGLHLVIYVMD